MKHNLGICISLHTTHVAATQRWSDWVVVVVVVLAVVLADILGLPPPSLISLSLTSLYFSQLARLSLHTAGWLTDSAAGREERGERREKSAILERREEGRETANPTDMMCKVMSD